MADGALTLRLDATLADRLRQAAAAAGSDVAEYAAQALDYVVPSVRDWSVDQEIAEETARDGTGIPLDEFLKHLDEFGRRTP